MRRPQCSDFKHWDNLRPRVRFPKSKKKNFSGATHCWPVIITCGDSPTTPDDFRLQDRCNSPPYNSAPVMLYTVYLYCKTLWEEPSRSGCAKHNARREFQSRWNKKFSSCLFWSTPIAAAAAALQLTEPRTARAERSSGWDLTWCTRQTTQN